MDRISKHPEVGSYVVVIGGMNMDIFGMPSEKLINRDSNPGVVGMSVGGVGQNIAQNLAHLEVPTYLLTVFGNDYNGRVMKDACAKNNIHLDYASELNNKRSSTYMYITDDTGDMQLGINDMSICKTISPAWLTERLDIITNAAICLVDANLSKDTIDWIGNHVTAPLFGDTVSVAKAPHFEGILNKMTLLKPNALEASLLSGIEIKDNDTALEAADILLDKGIGTICISLGAKGILIANQYEHVFVKPFKTKIVNANGAGDCGMAAITWSYFINPDLSIQEVGQIAQAASSIALESTKSVPDITVGKIKWKFLSRVVTN